MPAILRLWRTLRHLKPVQIYGRVWFRLARPKPDFSPAPSLRMATGSWREPARRRPGLISQRTFSFLNEEGSLDEFGWDDPTKPKLWRYNQHYFDDLNALEAGGRTGWHRQLIEDWIGSNPPGRGTGWEPYPVSLRIVNWIKWAHDGNDLGAEALASLAVQVRWLTRRLEWHLLGNHLFANAKALIFAGLFFEGPEAERWLRRGLSILVRELPEQVLADGGQFERSPMYHALAFEDILDLINIMRLYSPAQDLHCTKQLTAWEGMIPSMQRWLSAMCHPDGEISFFNDAAMGIAPPPGELVAYARRLGFELPFEHPPVTWLKASGYVRLDRGEAALICDMAPVGPDYLPGHAHADTLSFELSLYGQRVIVNSGTSVYGLGTERLRQRGTSAHSTVTVAATNSSDVWSGFRVGLRARPLGPSVRREGAPLIAECSHDGYRALRGRPTHKRSWALEEQGLCITDTVEPDHHPAEARFHLHPGVRLSLDNGGRGVLILPGGQNVAFECKGGPPRIEQGSWHPEFGCLVDNSCLVVPLQKGRARFHLRWD